MMSPGPPEHAKVRNGVRYTRTRSGCRTCRIRRVKCDEGRPACSRCSLTGRVCDGYGVWDRKPVLTSPIVKSKLNFGLDTFPCLDTEHQRPYIDWFIHRTIKKIPGIFTSEFWTKLVLQASTTEPAILYSMIALASAHKKEMMSPPSSYLPHEEQFMLQQYNKAIAQLRPHLVAHSQGSSQVAAIACLLFTCLEFMRRNYKTGYMHLQNGMKLILRLQNPSVTQDDTLVLGAGQTYISDCLIEAFARLYVQVAPFGTSSKPFSISITDPLFHSQDIEFASISIVRRHLDGILSRIHLLEQRCHEIRPRQLEELPTSLISNQRVVRADLTAWLRLYNLSDCVMKTYDDCKSVIAAKLLLTHYSMASIRAETCISPFDESIYDAYDSEFATLVTQCEGVLEAAAPQVAADISSGHCNANFSFSADMGLILPLYYTALKCRNPDIRRRAMTQLMSMPHQEGICDGPLTVCVLQRVVKVEEKGFYDELLNTSNWGECTRPPLPNSFRISQVHLELSDNGTNSLLLTYKQMLDSGEYTVVRETCYFSGRYEKPVFDRLT